MSLDPITYPDGLSQHEASAVMHLCRALASDFTRLEGLILRGEVGATDVILGLDVAAGVLAVHRDALLAGE